MYLVCGVYMKYIHIHTLFGRAMILYHIVQSSRDHVHILWDLFNTASDHRYSVENSEGTENCSVEGVASQQLKEVKNKTEQSAGRDLSFNTR